VLSPRSGLRIRQEYSRLDASRAFKVDVPSGGEPPRLSMWRGASGIPSAPGLFPLPQDLRPTDNPVGPCMSLQKGPVRPITNMEKSDLKVGSDSARPWKWRQTDPRSHQGGNSSVTFRTLTSMCSPTQPFFQRTEGSWPARRILMSFNRSSFREGTLGSSRSAARVNDLSMVGAQPLYLTAGFILEEGLPLSDLERIVSSMAGTAEVAVCCHSRGHESGRARQRR